jgi:S1-C subfamily serine protease
MALIPPFFLDCVIAIGFSKPDGKKNWGASGFLYGHFLNKISETEANYRIYLVTNRHVFQDERLAHIRFNPEANEPAREFDAPLFGEDGKPVWLAHEDKDIDMAVIQIDGNILRDHKIKFNFFHSDRHIMPLSQAHNIVTEGDNIYVLGFPMGLTGGERNYVIVRQGVIARVRDAIAGAAKTFLIDATIFPGNSGGPVVTRPQATAITGTQSVRTANLIGLVQGYIPYEDIAVSQQTKLPRIIFQENSGLGTVVPIDFVKHVIEEHQKLIKEEIAPVQTEGKM